MVVRALPLNIVKRFGESPNSLPTLKVTILAMSNSFTYSFSILISTGTVSEI